MSQLKKVNTLFANTDIWMDGFSVEDHHYALEHGSVGITTSPTWVAHMVCDEKEALTPDITALIKANPQANEHEILWKLTLQKAQERSAVVLPIFQEKGQKYGRFAVQLEVFEYRNADRMLEMALEVHALAPNMQVKIPCTKAGIAVMEEATYRGVSVMSTLGFSVDQAVEAAKAIERGLQRRTQEGLSNENINPICAVLLGMQEEWLQGYATKEKLVVDPEAFLWAGSAVCKKVSEIFKERKYSSRIIVAYYRHALHYSQFLGGDIIMTIPRKWQVRFDDCDIPLENNMEKAIPQEKLETLLKLKPFQQAYMEGSLNVEDFDAFPPAVLTLRYFMESYEKALHIVRNIMLPDYVK